MKSQEFVCPRSVLGPGTLCDNGYPNERQYDYKQTDYRCRAWSTVRLDAFGKPLKIIGDCPKTIEEMEKECRDKTEEECYKCREQQIEGYCTEIHYAS